MKPPALADDAWLADVDRVRGRRDRFSVWWLGQSGFLLHWQGRFLLLDPYLSDSLTTKYAATDKPHVRMTGRVVDPGRLAFVEAVTSSHNHTDHLDAETLRPLLRANPGIEVVVPAANRSFAAERLGVAVERLKAIDVDERLEVAGFTLHAVPAAHEQFDRNERGQYPYLGLVVGFGPWTVYHSGDTVRYEGMAERLRAWSIDLALLPINGRAPERRVSGNLWGREAAELASDAGIRQVIPCHYDMFAFNTAPPDEFMDECRRRGVGHTVLAAGERWDSPANDDR